MDLAREVLRLYVKAAREDPDLWGLSLLDLAADNVPDASLSDLKAAIVVSGVYARANRRVRREIEGYR